MSTPHTPRIEELLPAYALGALEGEELRELEEHLAGGCDECRRQLDLWRGDLEELAATVPPVEPSEITRARVLRLAGGAPGAAPSPEPSPSLPPRRAPWWLAAAALVLLAFAIWGLVRQSHLGKSWGARREPGGRARPPPRQVEALSREVGRLRTEVREARSVATERDRLRQQVEVLNREIGRAQTEVVQAKQALQVLAARASRR